jgi:hypothetical protein
MRLDGHAHDHVAIEIRGLGQGELGGGPDDLTLGLGARLEADIGARKPEVVELLGIDARDGARWPDLREIAGRGRGGLGGVVPAGESHDDERAPQALGLLEERQMVARGHVVVTSPRGCLRAKCPASSKAAGRKWRLTARAAVLIMTTSLALR